MSPFLKEELGNRPPLSVVVPLYNVEPFLDRCLASLEAQTLHGIEIVLVDDSSTDSTLSKAAEYAERNASWRIIRHEANRGLSAARNTGIAAAKGEFIGFVDSDDWVEPTMFETLLRIALKSECDIAQVQYELRSTTGKPAAQPNETTRTMTGTEALKEMLLSEKYAVWFMLYKRSLLGPIGPWFPEGLTCEDRVFNSKFLPKAHSVAASNRIEYYYFRNLGSLSHSGLTLRGLDLLEADKRVVSNVDMLGDEALSKLARERAAKGSYSLLVKWARFGATDPNLNESEVLPSLWNDFRKNYQTLTHSPLSAPKKLVAWQLRHCPALLKLEFSIYNAIAKATR